MDVGDWKPRAVPRSCEFADCCLLFFLCFFFFLPLVSAFALPGWGGSLAVLSHMTLKELTKAPTLTMDSVSFLNSTAGCQSQHAHAHAQRIPTLAARSVGELEQWGKLRTEEEPV